MNLYVMRERSDGGREDRLVRDGYFVTDEPFSRDGRSLWHEDIVAEQAERDKARCGDGEMAQSGGGVDVRDIGTPHGKPLFVLMHLTLAIKQDARWI